MPGKKHLKGVGAKEQDAAWYGVTSSRHIVADEFPWYGKIEQGTDRLGEMIQKGKGAEYDRLLGTIAEHIEREKASAAPVMTEFSPRLRELSEKIDGALHASAAPSVARGSSPAVTPTGVYARTASNTQELE